jgi:hypothetical protein
LDYSNQRNQTGATGAPVLSRVLTEADVKPSNSAIQGLTDEPLSRHHSYYSLVWLCMASGISFAGR